MKAVSKKLTLKEVQERVKAILARRTVACGKSSWQDPEGVQGLIDDLRTDVIQAIADGSKVPYALTRCISRVHYGTIPSEPARTTVEKVTASFARSFNKNNNSLPTQSHDDEVALVERYQQCVSALLSMFESDPLGDSPAHFYIERLEALIERKLIGPVKRQVDKVVASSTYGQYAKAICSDCHQKMKLDEHGHCFRCAAHHSTPSTGMSSEQYHAIREFLFSDTDEPSENYPSSMSPRALREAFDELVRMHEKRKLATERIIKAANTFLEACEVDVNANEIPY